MLRALKLSEVIAEKANNARTKAGKEWRLLQSQANRVSQWMESELLLSGIEEEPDGIRVIGTQSQPFSPESVAHPDATKAWDALPAYDGENGADIRLALAGMMDMLTPRGNKAGPWMKENRDGVKSRAFLAEQKAKAEAANAEWERKQKDEADARREFLSAHPEAEGMTAIYVMHGGEIDPGHDYGGYMGRETKLVALYRGPKTQEKLRNAAALSGFDFSRTSYWSEYSSSIGGGALEIRYSRIAPDYAKLRGATLEKVSDSLYMVRN